MSWNFSWLRDWNEVWSDENVGRWSNAFSPSYNGRTHPFMHPQVVRAWLETSGQHRFEPFFLHSQHSDGRNVFLLLVRQNRNWRRGFVRTLVPVGGNLFDYHDPIVVAGAGGEAELDDDFWLSLKEELSRRGGAWFDHLHWPGLRDLGRGVASRQGKPTQFLRLHAYANAEDYLESRSSKFRASLRRMQRLLRNAGELQFHVHGPSDTDRVAGWLPKLIEHRGAKHSTGMPDDFWLRYFSRLIAHGLAGGVVHCSSITLDGQGVSWELNFFERGVLYGYAAAFDQDFQRFSPGSLHKYFLIDWLLQNGGVKYDFMRGRESYKDRWTDGDEAELGMIQIWSGTPQGQIHRLLYGGARNFRSLVLRRKPIWLGKGLG